MKILVADDDAVSRSMMRRMLMHSGYDVATATNGAEAVEILTAEEGPRLVLLDWMMPELNGPEVCQAIRTASARPYTYITLLTSKESKEDLVAGLEAGADDYLIKPCNLEELRARLRTGQRILQLEDILVRAHDEMRHKATFDVLTNLLNRGAILQHLASALNRVDGRGFSVILCDVDNFKRINDTFGHPVGDDVLREVASRLRQSAGACAAVGRYGGEEFLIVADESHATSVAQNICRCIRDQPITTRASQLSVSISAGALNVTPANIHLNSDEILKIVDDALYQAKRGGRDRVVSALEDNRTEQNDQRHDFQPS